MSFDFLFEKAVLRWEAHNSGSCPWRDAIREMARAFFERTHTSLTIEELEDNFYRLLHCYSTRAA